MFFVFLRLCINYMKCYKYDVVYYYVRRYIWKEYVLDWYDIDLLLCFFW